MSEENNGEMTFLEHLEELRWHLVRSILAIIIFAIAAFVFKEIVFDDIIMAPKAPGFLTNRLMCQFGNYMGTDKLCINSKPLELININMSGQFTAHILVSLIAGLIVAFPYVIYEVWRFVAPALYANEKRYSAGAVFFISLLFGMGVIFGYFVIVPLSIHFLGSYQVSVTVANQINLVSYMTTVASIVLACGVIFELPALVFFATKIGLITPDFLKSYRKHAVIVILLLSAIITPPDIFSQVLVALPIGGLYELSIVISKMIKRKEEQSALAEIEKQE